MSLRGCLCLQAASAQTAGPIKYATKAVRPGVLLVCASAFGSADCGLCPGRAAANERGGSSQNRKQMCSANGKRTGKHPCARQDLARRVRRLAIDEMETAQQAVKTLTALWLQELDAGPSDQANALKKQLDEAEAKLKRAKKEFEEAEQKYGSKASVQAGRGPGGFCVCSCCC